MPDLRSPLAEHLHAGDYGPVNSDEPAIVLAEKPLGTLLQIAGWEGFEKQCLELVSEIGLEDLGSYRTYQISGDVQCYRIAPDRILLRHLTSDVFTSLLSANDPEILATLDLSHSRCVISVKGPAVETLLAMVAPLDFSLSAFPVGNFAQTGIHHVSVLIRRNGPHSFEIFAPVTWAASLWDYLRTNAAGVGYRIEGSKM